MNNRGRTGIAQSRLDNQRIARGALNTPDEVVGWLGAVQAQDYLGALWAVGLRMRKAVESDIEDALAARTIVRTWPMRGTLHFVPAADVRWMLSLLTPRVIASTAGRHRQLELDDAVFMRSEKILVRALEGGRQLSRPAIYALLDAEGISAGGGRGLHILSWLAQKQALVFGTREGKQHTFALLDEWVPASRELSREESLAELATRYFSSHGPATEQDFSWWSGLPLRAVREAVALAGSRLEQSTFAGVAMWFSASGPAVQKSDSPRAFLLPPFDEFTVAYRSRDLIVDPAFARQVVAGGMLSPVIVIDGRVGGIWGRTLKKQSVVVKLRLFAPLMGEEFEAVVAAADRYGAFLGLSVELE